MIDPIRLPDVADDENDLINGLLKVLDARKPRNLLRTAYYDGERVIRRVGPVVPPEYYRLGIVLGWCAKAVDLLSRRCNLDGFAWADGDLDSLGLSEVFEDNYLSAEADAAGVSSLIHGVSFLVNTEGGDGEPASLIHVKDALNATGEWNSRARRLDNLLSVTGWDDEGRPNALALYLDGETIDAVKDQGRWETERHKHSWGVPAEPLVYKYRPNRPFGSSRISGPSMALHDRALASLIRLEGHMDIYSSPEFWMLGADQAIFKNDDGSVKNEWQVRMGRIKGIPDDDEAPPELARADVKQFQAASPEPHLAQLNALSKLFARENSLPDTAVAITDLANPTSAEAYDASQNDLVSEAEGTTDDWAPAFKRAMVRALAIKNGLKEIPAEWRTIAPQWRSPKFESRAAQADAGQKQLAAVPWLAETEVGLELLGLSPEQARRALSEKRRASGSKLLDRLRAQQRPPVIEDENADDDRGTAEPDRPAQ
ncbi:portal protein [Gordonia phage PhorbesPhlower]|nr:portal protein [Gordonia phage PhorbesPhlower]UUG69864.1 portal protein [Gordonia phage Morkie]